MGDGRKRHRREGSEAARPSTLPLCGSSRASSSSTTTASTSACNLLSSRLMLYGAEGKISRATQLIQSVILQGKPKKKKPQTISEWIIQAWTCFSNQQLAAQHGAI